MTLGFFCLFVYFFVVALLFFFFLHFLSRLWLIWGTFGSPWSHMGVPEGILQP